MMTETKGYCAKYIPMGSEDTHMISRDLRHHDRADWLEEWHGKVHVISPMSTAWLEQGIASDTDLGTRPDVVGDSHSFTILSRVGCSR